MSILASDLAKMDQNTPFMKSGKVIVKVQLTGNRCCGGSRFINMGCKVNAPQQKAPAVVAIEGSHSLCTRDSRVPSRCAGARLFLYMDVLHLRACINKDH